jgi:hypothetical protein
MEVSKKGKVTWQNVTWDEAYAGGPVTVEVEATNADEETATRQWSLTVVPIAPELRSLSSDTVDDGEEYTKDLASRLKRGTVVAWELVSGPEGMKVDAKSGVVTWTAELESDPITVEIRAKGRKDTEALGSWELTVNAVPVVIGDIRNASIDDGEEFTLQPELVSGSPPVTWLLDEAPDGMRIDPHTGEITWQVEYSPDPVEVVLHAINPADAQPEQRFEIRVAPLPPVLEKMKKAKVRDFKTYTATVKLSEAATQPVRYRLVQAPDGAVIGADSGQVFWEANLDDSPATFEVRAEGPERFDSTSWEVEVQAVKPSLPDTLVDETLEEGDTYIISVEPEEGTGEIQMELEGAPSGMLVSPPTNEIGWVVTSRKKTVALKLKAKNRKGSVEKEWTLTINPAEDEAVVEPCQRQLDETPAECCEPKLKIACRHVVEERTPGQDLVDLRAGTHGWAGFHVSPFPEVNPRHYVMELPTADPPENANERRYVDWPEGAPERKAFRVGKRSRGPVYQVQAGYKQNPDVVNVALEHAEDCEDPEPYMPVVGTLEKAVKWTTSLREDSEKKKWQGRFTAPAHDQVLASMGPVGFLAGDLYVLANLNPFRWPHLRHREWRVFAYDLNTGAVVTSNDQRLEAWVQAYSDIRWEVNVTLSRSSPTEEGGQVLDISAHPPSFEGTLHTDENGDLDPVALESDSGWGLTGICKCTFDQYTMSLEVGFLSCIESAIPFLKTIDSMGSFLEKVSSYLPIGMSVGLVKPSLSVYVAAEPYEQDEVGLIGYQFKIGLYAAPLIGIEIEWNLVYFILAAFPLTAPAVIILQALKTGVGVKGVARLQVDIGIYLIAGGTLGLELEWAYQWPDGAAAYGQLDGRIYFKIEGRCEAEIEVLVVSAGAGVRIGAKTAIGLTGKADWATQEGDDNKEYRGVDFRGQARWEGIVLYAIAYYKAGLKIGCFKRGTSRTRSSTKVICKPHYMPKAPKPHRVGGKKPD